MDTVQLAKNMNYTYTFMDKLFRMSIGETADFSCALYNNHFSLTLEEAQLRKHEEIVEKLNIGEGSKVLDVGCGWGPGPGIRQEKRAQGIGVTLSSGQAKACRANALIYAL